MAVYIINAIEMYILLDTNSNVKEIKEQLEILNVSSNNLFALDHSESKVFRSLVPKQNLLPIIYNGELTNIGNKNFYLPFQGQYSCVKFSNDDQVRTCTNCGGETRRILENNSTASTGKKAVICNSIFAKNQIVDFNLLVYTMAFNSKILLLTHDGCLHHSWPSFINLEKALGYTAYLTTTAEDIESKIRQSIFNKG